ncbi:MAG TPA: hypothetical protein VGH32_12145 [Pirellulales bacterium]|jgi:hypothetical protein
MDSSKLNSKKACNMSERDDIATDRTLISRLDNLVEDLIGDFFSEAEEIMGDDKNSSEMLSGLIELATQAMMAAMCRFEIPPQILLPLVYERFMFVAVTEAEECLAQKRKRGLQ